MTIYLKEIAKTCKDSQCEVTVTVQPDGTQEVTARPWRPTRYSSVSEDLPQIEGTAKYMKAAVEEAARIQKELARIGGLV